MSGSIPTNQVSRNGVGAVSDSQLNTYVQTDQTATQLRNFVGASGMSVMLQGIAAPGDGKAGFFYWDSGIGFIDDNLNTIVPPAADAGAWIRLTVLNP